MKWVKTSWTYSTVLLFASHTHKIDAADAKLSSAMQNLAKKICSVSNI